MNVEWVVFEMRLDRDALLDGPLVWHRHKLGTVHAADARSALNTAAREWRGSVRVQSRLGWDLDAKEGTARP